VRSFTTQSSNTRPVATHDGYALDEDANLVVAAPGVLSNDFDADGDPLTVAVAGEPIGGVLTLNVDGSFTYVPNADFQGIDSFSYFLDDGEDASIATVNLTVHPFEDVPVATHDVYHVVLGSTVETAAPGVLTNDVEPDGQALVAVLDRGPSKGDLTLSADGSFSYVPWPGFDGSDSFTYRASDGQNVSERAIVTIHGRVWADFDSDANGFVYGPDVFRGTSNAAYASGAHLAAGGYSGGALAVTLGGHDDVVVLGMSGGWSRSFSLSAASATTLSFRFQLTYAANYEPDESAEALVAVDGALIGTNGADFVARFAGDGDGGLPQTTGWTLVELDLGILDPGTHTIVLGGYSNKKTFNDETTEILVDEVVVEFLGFAATGAPVNGPAGGLNGIALAPNYPNPFRPSTTIEYTLPADGDVRLSVYNVHGQVVRRLVDERQTSGQRRVVWEGRDDAGRAVAAGVYFLRLDAGDRRVTRKMILQR
ncbi:MAG: Ig-like domain-containing protein, partial [bacterium]